MLKSYMPVIGPALLATGALVAAANAASAAEEASATMMNANGESVGSVTLRATLHGTLLHAKLENLPPGAHA
ncbi:MAG: hypothetical protein OXH76_17805, partial [Boseongicola sp.]|nr:hypothetical protein [Boseongicola sp.]